MLPVWTSWVSFILSVGGVSTGAVLWLQHWLKNREATVVVILEERLRYSFGEPKMGTSLVVSNVGPGVARDVRVEFEAISEDRGPKPPYRKFVFVERPLTEDDEPEPEDDWPDDVINEPYEVPDVFAKDGSREARELEKDPDREEREMTPLDWNVLGYDLEPRPKVVMRWSGPRPPFPLQELHPNEEFYVPVFSLLGGQNSLATISWNDGRRARQVKVTTLSVRAG